MGAVVFLEVKEGLSLASAQTEPEREALEPLGERPARLQEKKANVGARPGHGGVA
jgi:hypothetical protein